MKRAEYNEKINAIVKRLTEIHERDYKFIQPRSSQPVVISLDELTEFGKRYDERAQLHHELRQLTTVKVED